MREDLIRRFKISSKLGEELINSILYIIKNFKEENPNYKSLDISFIPFEKFIEDVISSYLQQLRKFNFCFLEKFRRNLSPLSKKREGKIEKFISTFRKKTNKILVENNLREEDSFLENWLTNSEVKEEEYKSTAKKMFSSQVKQSPKKLKTVKDDFEKLFEIGKIKLNMKDSVAKFIEIIDENNFLVGGIRNELIRLKFDKNSERADIEVLSERMSLTDLVYLQEAKCGFAYNSDTQSFQKFNREFEFVQNYRADFDLNFGKKIKKFGDVGDKKVMLNIGRNEVMVLTDVKNFEQSSLKISEIPGDRVQDLAGSSDMSLVFLSSDGCLSFYRIDEELRYKKTQVIRLKLCGKEECLALGISDNADYCAVTTYSSKAEDNFSAKLHLFSKDQGKYSLLYTLKFSENARASDYFCFYLINMSYSLSNGSPVIILSQFAAPHKIFTFYLNSEKKIVEYTSPFPYHESECYKFVEDDKGGIWSIDSKGRINNLKFNNKSSN